MTTDRFNPKPETPYATCIDCDAKPATPEELKEHFESTTPPSGGKSHRVRMTNLGRAERIAKEIGELAEVAISDFVNDVDELIARDDASEDEIEQAVRSIGGEFAQAWEDGR